METAAVIVSDFEKAMHGEVKVNSVMFNKFSKEQQKIYMCAQISDFLLGMGVSPAIIGFDYLVDAIYLAVNDTTRSLLIVKDIYGNIAKTYNSTPMRVERAMRHAVERGFDWINTERIEEVFGAAYDFNKGKPTNKQFVYTCAKFISRHYFYDFM